jgi:hypothetical protein
LYTGPLAGRCPDLCLRIDGLRCLSSDRVGGAHPSLVLDVAPTPLDLLGPPHEELDGRPLSRHAASRIEGRHGVAVPR